jgi:hypothetical protein
MRFKNRQKNQQKIPQTLNEADCAAHGMSACRSAENRSVLAASQAITRGALLSR